MGQTQQQSKSKTLKTTFHTMTFLSLLNISLTELHVFTNVIYKRRLGRDIMQITIKREDFVPYSL